MLSSHPGEGGEAEPENERGAGRRRRSRSGRRREGRRGGGGHKEGEYLSTSNGKVSRRRTIALRNRTNVTLYSVGSMNGEGEGKREDGEGYG